MTPAQAFTLKRLSEEGFVLTQETREIIRMAKGADLRVIKADGTAIRGHHESLPFKSRTAK